MEKPKYKWDLFESSPEEVQKILNEALMSNIFPGTLEGTFKLDNEAKEIVLKEMAKNCAEFCMEKFGLKGKTDMDIDAVVSEMNMAGPQRRNIKRVGDTIFWEACVGDIGMGCLCPLVTCGLLKPTPELCKCFANWVKYIVEKSTGKKVDCELVDSVNTGAEHCHCRLHLTPSIYTSKAGS